MSRPQNIDALVAAFRDFVQALARHRDGHIGAADDITTAQTSLADALRAALGGVKERADG